MKNKISHFQGESVTCWNKVAAFFKYVSWSGSWQQPRCIFNLQAGVVST